VLEYDISWIGKEFDRYAYNVTKEEIVEFAQSVGEINPLYTDEAYAKTTPYGGLIAPPTFCVVFRSHAVLQVLVRGIVLKHRLKVLIVLEQWLASRQPQHCISTNVLATYIIHEPYSSIEL